MIPPGRKQRLLLRIERFSRERWRLVSVATLLLLGVSVSMGSRIRLESDVLRLIPEGNRQVDTFREALREFGSIDFLIVLLEAGDGEGPDDLEEFADAYAARLAAESELVESVEYRFRPDARFMELFSENALLFVPPSELQRIADRLTDEAIRSRVGENRLTLASPAGSMMGTLIHEDPLGLMPVLIDRLLAHRGALKVDLSDGYYLSGDGRSLIMLVKPTRPSQDLAFSRELVLAARRIAAEAGDEVGRSQEVSPSIRVRLGGNYAQVPEETVLLRETIVRSGVVSFVAVIALYWICYRRIAALFYSSVPLIVGQAFTFALAAATLGSLNSSSAGVPALLMGLGTDFTILMYARYVEERRLGADLATATERMVGETGLGVFTGAITSAGTFYAMCSSGFGGLRDLGFLVGTGILMCAVVIVFLLPAMIAWIDGRPAAASRSFERLRLRSIGLERLMPWSARRRGTVIAASVVVTVAAGWAGTRLDFDDSLAALRSNHSASYKVQQDVQERFGAALSYMMVIVEAPDTERAVALADTVRGRLDPLVASGTIASYDSILTYLPIRDQQERVLGILREGSHGAFDVERIAGTLERELQASGFRVEAFETYLAGVRRLLAPQRPITLDDLEGKGLGRIVDRYVHRDPSGVRLVTYLHTSDPRWRKRPPPGLVEAISRNDPGIVVTGTNVVGLELRNLFLRDAARAVILGLALVAVLLLVDFRSVRLTAVALAQLLTGVIWMLGGMRLLGTNINYANAFVATMIMGVGIDYSIHLVHRLHRNGGVLDDGALETGKGVVLAALTNVAGFGTLALGNYPAMRSFGIVALLGSITCLLTSLTLVPALMARTESR